MNRALAEAVVRCMGLSRKKCEAHALTKFSLQDWRRTVRWLDRTGLTLYLLQRLRDINATPLLLPPMLTRLKQNLADNRRRIDYMAGEFALLNLGLDRAGVKYAAVKGFSLVPAYCPDAVLRAPSDLDYLVDQASLPVAQRVLEEAGYRLQSFSDIEFKFGRPLSRIATVSDDPYLRETEPLVELHLTFWNKKVNRVPLIEPTFRLDQTISHDWQGLHFPALNEEDAFVLQILHIFQHTLEGWIKLGWLLEIGYFLRTRLSNTQFWIRLDARMREVPYLIEFTAVVIGLANEVFAAPLPPVAAKWMQALRPPCTLWLRNYGRRWAMEEQSYESMSWFPANKLSLFLHRQFVPDPAVRKTITVQRLLPWKRPLPIALPTAENAPVPLSSRRRQWQFVSRRFVFHLGSASRYLFELPRWRTLNKQSRSNNLHGFDSSSPADLSSVST